MPRMFFLIVLMGVVSFPGCIRLRSVGIPYQPPLILEECLFFGGVELKDDWAQPVQPKKVFVKGQDQRICSFLRFREVSGEHALVWKWYDPSGKIYRTTDPTNVGKEGQFYKKYIAWDNILLFEEKEAGKWKVTVFLDGQLLAAEEFEIRSESFPKSILQD
ncbi:MAG: hypothetical protein WCC06_10005 [Candidatus Aminicenantales bacterium]